MTEKLATSITPLILITTRYGPPGASFESKFCLREDKIQSDGRHIACDEEILARLDRLREKRHISAYFCFFRTFSGSSLVPVYSPQGQASFKQALKNRRPLLLTISSSESGFVFAKTKNLTGAARQW